MRGLWTPVRSALFQLDAERAHHAAIAALSRYSGVCPPAPPNKDPSRSPDLVREIMGLTFPNPFGIAAGFDKDAACVPALSRLGFGFIEVGTLTWHPQPGNPKPRLFRLKRDGALFNRLGFNNLGARAAASRIERWRVRGRVVVPLGINIGRSKIVDNKDAPADYESSIAALHDLADYLVINVSSPNTPGLRDLQAEDALAELLDVVMNAVLRRASPKPVLLKLAPDLDDDGARTAAELAQDRGLTGLIVSNTTIDKSGLDAPDGNGGISGRPLFARSTAMLAALKNVAPKLVYIGVGGVMDGDDAVAKLDAGADLVQCYTGFVFAGPRFPRQVCAAITKDRAPAPS